MIALKIIGIVFSAIILVIAIILCLPLFITVESKTGEKTLTYAQILFFKFGKKGKKKKKKNDKTSRNAILKLFGLDTEKSTETDSESSSDTVNKIKRIANTVLSLFSRVPFILKRCTVKELLLNANVGGTDAAQTAIEYGLLCAAVYPLTGFIDANIPCCKNALDVSLKCNFDEPVNYNFYLSVKIRTVHILRALVYIIKNEVQKDVTK